MGHSYSNVLVHVVFSTKNRAKIIPRDRQEDLWRYMTGISKNIKVNVIAIGGMPDHVHMLIALPGTNWTFGRNSNGQRELIQMDGTQVRVARGIRRL